MKKLLLLSLLLLFGCNETDYKVVNTRIIKGRISAKEQGHVGRTSTPPKIYIQTPTQTISVDLPFANENDFKVGDSTTIIVQQVEIRGVYKGIGVKP